MIKTRPIKLMAVSLLGLLALTPMVYAGYSLMYNFTSSDPNVHEQFYCTVTGTKDTEVVNFQNFSEMIKGFERGGLATHTVADVNKYYFDAYHDPNARYDDSKGMVIIGVGDQAANITCAPGTDGRPLIPGDYNVHAK